MFRRSGYETGSTPLHFLESSDKMYENAVQQAVSIVKACRHVCMNHNLSGFPVKEISKVDICHRGNVLHAVVHA